MLAILLVVYAVVVLASVVFIFPGARNRLPWPAARRVALIASLFAIGYTVFSPACVYLPSVPAAPAIRRILLGEDQGQLYWLEGTITRFAFARGPRWWLTYPIPGVPWPAGLQSIPPLRLARMDQRETRWALVRSDGQRFPYPRRDWGYLARLQVVGSGGVVWSAGIVNALDRFHAPSGTWTPITPERENQGFLESLIKTDRGLVAVYEHNTGRIDGVYIKKRDLVLKELDNAGKVINERRYVLDDWADGPGWPRRAIHLAFADGKIFAAQVAPKGVDGVGKVLIFPDSGGAIEVCSFAYSYYHPFSFAVSADGRYFSTGQAVWRMDGSHLMPLVPILRMVNWQGSSVVGIRSFPLVGTKFLDRDSNVNAILDWVRTTDPETVFRRFGSYGRGFDGALFENLSLALRRRPAWDGGIDDSGGEDEIVTVEVR